MGSDIDRVKVSDLAAARQPRSSNPPIARSQRSRVAPISDASRFGGRELSLVWGGRAGRCERGVVWPRSWRVLRAVHRGAESVRRPVRARPERALMARSSKLGGTDPSGAGQLNGDSPAAVARAATLSGRYWPICVPRPGWRAARLARSSPPVAVPSGRAPARPWGEPRPGS